MEQFETWAGKTEKDIVHFFNPGFDYTNRVTAGWPMTRFDHALYVLAAYAALVLVGLVIRASSRKVTPEKKEVVEQSVSRSFASEPIKYLVVVYNAVQARGG